MASETLLAAAKAGDIEKLQATPAVIHDCAQKMRERKRPSLGLDTGVAANGS
jgi:hypothetical protein